MDPARQLRILRQHLQTDRLLGVDAVPIREALDAADPAMFAVAPDQQRAPRPVPAAAAKPPATPTASAPRSTPAPSIEVPTDPALKLPVLQELDRTQVQGCTRCELHRGRTQTVFGEGNPDADLMVVGEGPGSEEDRSGRPFVGRAGELLNKQIQAMGLSREQIYIANVVKCRPPNNRTPTPQEADTCGHYLRQQIEVIQPKVILTVGGPAVKLLTGKTEGITRLRGQWLAYDQVDPPIPLMPTFHPAYLLRAYTKENRAKVWSDLQQVIERLKS